MLVLLLTGAALYGWTVKFLAGLAAGFAAALVVGGYALLFDRNPALFCTMAVTFSVLIRAAPRGALWTTLYLAGASLLVLIVVSAPIAPAVELALAGAIAFGTLAYRGWANKQLVD